MKTFTDSAILPLDNYLREMNTCLQEDLYTNVLSSFIPSTKNKKC